MDIVTRVNGVQADSLNGGLAPEFPAGTPLSWTYEVSNSGAGRLRNIQVEDERGLAVTCPRAALDPGQDMTCTAESLAEDISASPDRTAGNCSGVPGVDLLPGGAKVTARTALESNIDASDPAYYCNDSGRFRINAGLNDAWFNPATAGQGFFINVFEDLGLMFLAWFTFDAERPAGDVDSVLGDPGHRWLTAFGPYDGDEALLAIESTTGGVFNQAEPKPDQAPDGFIRVSFESCSEATVGYQIDSAKRESGIPLIRILNDNVPACEERASAPPEARAQVRKPDIRPASDGFQMGPGLNDAWWDPAKGGQGFFINVYPETGLVFLSWFTYDTERPDDDTPSRLGDPGHRWLTAFGSFDGNRAELDVEMTTGGILDSGDPKPDQAKDGSMVLEFTGCNAGTVTYDIPSADVSGTVDIQRVALDNVDDCEAEQAEVR